MNIEDSGYKVHEESLRGAHELEDRIIKEDEIEKSNNKQKGNLLGSIGAGDSSNIHNMDY